MIRAFNKPHSCTCDDCRRIAIARCNAVAKHLCEPAYLVIRGGEFISTIRPRLNEVIEYHTRLSPAGKAAADVTI